ncbi:site-specific DNA-methyltransferase [Helicobacter pylori]|uniref:site-specific DNA-methyltransferase n=1 Tax=Helicobacter pylori TaxID=210 RepID=UPI001E2E8478|nr:site-specific DNA-methyltransferase [Helicobacter pylori]
MESLMGGGGDNFVADFIRKTKSTTNDAKTGVNYQHEFLLCYAKNKEFVNLLGGEKNLENYKNPDNDPNGAWISDNPSAKSGNIKTGYFGVTNPYTNKVDYPPVGMFWRFSQNTIQKHIDEGRICFKKEHKDNERGFIYKRYLKDLKTTQKTFDSLAFSDNCYMNQAATKELIALGFAEIFKNAKPESLIATILEHASKENDLVCDFFAGSGTTCAVAHKLKRKYIGIEMGEHFDSVILPRLKKVVGGFKSGAIKEFNGGGAIKVYELESYEEILRKIKYENNDKPLSYDEQYSHFVEHKDNSYVLNIEALEGMGVDIKETLENLCGIGVEFFNEKMVKFKGNDKEVEILKALKEALIW